MKPKFFKTPDEFRAWLEKNHDKATEVWVGSYKKAANRKTITWEDAVDVALCFGWIDSVGKPIDELRRMQRFTPRRPKSNWSKRNIDRVAELSKAGLIHPAGLAAFDRRFDAGYSYEEAQRELSAPYDKRLRANKKASAFYDKQPPSYRKVVNHWVNSAKRDETRERRFTQLVEACAKGERLRQFVSPAKR